ncbi:hypothetical protein [Nocardia farcinica]|uniref:hypothetical protein n=1 Tax=Nocardia farcinica TaxID=37329 RepID=UPI0024552410|nr:hypothetical protein [Nocardia farcinica]
MNAPKKCDFCGRSAPEVRLTREHVLAQSLREAFVDSREHSYERAWLEQGELRSASSARPLNLLDVVSRRLCQPCNNGWMSELEAAAKPILLRLITGERSLTTKDARTVRRWLAKTAVVCHFAEPNSDDPAAVDPADRALIMRGGVPPRWRFLLGTLDSPWRNHLHRSAVRAPKQRTIGGRLITEIYHFSDIELGCFIGCVIGCPPHSDVGDRVTKHLADGMRKIYPFFADITNGGARLDRIGRLPDERALNEIAVVFAEGLSQLGS